MRSASDSGSVSTGIGSSSADESSMESDALDVRRKAADPDKYAPPATSAIDGSPVKKDGDPMCAPIEEAGSDSDEEDINELNMRSSVAAVFKERSSHSGPDILAGVAANQTNDEDTAPVALEGPLMSFTEFLRVNMRLAEDRVLSFVTVFSTGFGTKWIPGATFYYEPEVTFGSLLTQRYSYQC